MIDLFQTWHDGDLGTLKSLINDLNLDPSFIDNYLIRWAIASGHKDVVKFLLTDERVMDNIEYVHDWCKRWDGYELLKVCVDEHKREEKQRRVQEAIKVMSSDCELYF